MNYNELKLQVQPLPYKEWYKKLEPGNLIWLTKLKTVGVVTRTINYTGLKVWIPLLNKEKLWHINDWGCSFDGSQVIEPIKGHFPIKDSDIISYNNTYY